MYTQLDDVSTTPRFTSPAIVTMVVLLLIILALAIWILLLLRQLRDRAQRGGQIINVAAAEGQPLDPNDLGDVSIDPVLIGALSEVGALFDGIFKRGDRPLLGIHGVQLGLDAGQKHTIAWRLDGTHVGTYRGIAATGQAVTVDGVTVVVRGDGIDPAAEGGPRAEDSPRRSERPLYKTYFNELDLLTQLGVPMYTRPLSLKP